ncbi:MAG: hypothetical protein U1A27_11900 [Phycisphaerae bacterium]
MSLLADWLDARRTFPGGLYLPDDKGRTARRPIRPLPLCGPLRVPLQRAADLPTRIGVRAGQRVAAGELLAEPAAPDSLPVHAPTAGQIQALTRAWLPRDGWLPAADLAPDRPADWHAAPLGAAPAPARTLEELRQASVFEPLWHRPLHAVLAQAGAARADHLVISAVETEPLLTADLRTLIEDQARIVQTIEQLAGLIEPRPARVSLAVCVRHRRVVRELRARVAHGAVRVVALNDKFPQDHPRLLSHVVARRRVPAIGSPLDAKVCVLSLAAVRAAADAVCDGRPSVSRVVTLAGDAVGEPENYLVPFGTPAQLLARAIARSAVTLVAGGLMTGVARTRRRGGRVGRLRRTERAVERRARGATPCVHCGWCIEDCPVGIDPVALFPLDLVPQIDARRAREARSCIQCGLCSYVCPAALPLAESLARTAVRLAWPPGESR